MTKTFEQRLLELVKSDKELRQALIELVEAQTKAAYELAAWRSRRK